MKRRMCSIITMAVLLGSLTACGSGSPAATSAAATSAAAATGAAAEKAADTTAAQKEAAETITLKIGSCAPESSIFVGNAQIFADKLSELSGGSIQCDIVGGGALGNIPQHFAQLNDGTLDIFVQGVDAPSAVKGGEDFGILNVPFLFDDVDHFHKFLDSDVFASMMGHVQEENGFSFLGLLGDRPARSLSTKNKEVRVPADMKGLVLRVPESAVPMAVFQAWGANTTTGAANAIFEGLQSGQFDGQDNGIETMVLDGYMEVQNVYMSFDHTQQGVGAFLSNVTADKLSDEQKGWLDEALQYAYEISAKKLWNEDVPSYREAMKEKGITLVDDVDVEAFRAIVEDMIPDFEGKYFSAGLYDQIRALK